MDTTPEDERMVAASRALLKKARDLSALTLLIALAYCTIAIRVVGDGATTFPAIVVTATVISLVWHSRRVLFQIPKYRRILSDPAVKALHPTMLAIVTMDATILVGTAACATWLVGRLIHAT